MDYNFKAGDRVRYIGKYIQAVGLQRNPKEDLAPQSIGTIVQVWYSKYPLTFPLIVQFDDHSKQYTWPLTLDEVEKI